jgi:hypothetical protein
MKSLDELRKLCEATSIRQVAKEEGIPRSTLQGWLADNRRPRKFEHRESRITDQEVNPENPIVRAYVVKKLSRWRSLTSLASELNIDPATLEEVVSHLDDSGYMVETKGRQVRISKHGRRGTEACFNMVPITDEVRKFGVVSDNHLCNKHARLDVLEEAYNRFAELGITNVFNAGNMVDGEFRFNKHEILAHGITDQTNYFLDHYPQRSGITTHFVTGDCHEGWWRGREGIDWGRWLVYEARDRGRDDFNYLGFMEADVFLPVASGGGSYIRIYHPGGGTAYAQSYKTQKIVESLQGGEKPGMLICGHYHKAIYHVVRNVHVIQAATTCDQTTFMRKKNIEAHVGFWVVELQQDSRGAIRRVKPEQTLYFDRAYHEVPEINL